MFLCLIVDLCLLQHLVKWAHRPYKAWENVTRKIVCHKSIQGLKCPKRYFYSILEHYTIVVTLRQM